VAADSLCHFAVDTGLVRRTPRSEVTPEVIAQLAPLLKDGDHQMPGPTGYRVRVRLDGPTLAATVRREGGGDLVSVIVCTDDATTAKAAGVEMLPLTTPCCLVKLHLGMAHAPQAAGWLTDFQRCLAWAWIERCELGRALTVPVPIS
jgi:hypothetical protein